MPSHVIWHNIFTGNKFYGWLSAANMHEVATQIRPISNDRYPLLVVLIKERGKITSATMALSTLSPLPLINLFDSKEKNAKIFRPWWCYLRDWKVGEWAWYVSRDSYTGSGRGKGTNWTWIIPTGGMIFKQFSGLERFIPYSYCYCSLFFTLNQLCWVLVSLEPPIIKVLSSLS